ncbi:MAG: diguanylate cyclase, partial [Enterobacterales bacterium]|nr:diguanylate cyclase [Enterobacterales bacterium]
KRVRERTVQLEHEIHEKELAKKQAEDLSLSDSLTALPNRRAFLAELDAALARNQRYSKHSFSLLFIDLDGFKTINDILGHYAGDIVLIEIAKRLSGLIRANDFCSRLGGDEFVILLDDMNTKQQAVNIVNKLLATISAPISFNKQVMAVSASIGVYLHKDYYGDASSVLTMADEAMYEAKARGKDCFVFFNHDLHRRVRENTSLIQMLDQAMKDKEFEIYFQPICNINGVIIGVESLARWIHEGEMIPPEKIHSAFRAAWVD